MSLFPFLSDTTSRRRLIVLWALFLFALIVTASMFAWLGSIDYELAWVRGDGIVNLELAWDKHTVQEIVQGWHKEGLLPTARKSIYWDFLLILGYLTTLISGFMLAWGPLIRSDEHKPIKLYLIAALPVFAALCDISENVLMLWALSDKGEIGSVRSMLTMGFAYVKFALIGFYFAAVLYLARPVLSTIARARFSIIILIVCVAMLSVPQWQEMLRSIMEANENAGINWLALFLAVASLIAALSTWYSSRVMFMFCVEPKRNEDDMAAGEDDCSHEPMLVLKTWLPRVTGFAVIVLVFLGFIVSAPSGHYAGVIEPGVYQLLALLVFVAFVIYRREIKWLSFDSPITDFARGFKDLSPKTKYPLLVLAVGNVLCFLCFLFFPFIAVFVGGAAVAVFAIALAVPWGNLLVYAGTRLNFPVLTAVVVSAVLLSMVNDNHSIRLCEGMGSTELECPANADKVAADEPPASESGESGKFDDFMNKWIVERGIQKKKSYPVFIVSAEGGGIRAAFWTAHVLATLQEQTCTEKLDFSRHLLAISGVSGGSLGGAVFAASVKRLGNICQDDPERYSQLAHDVLSNDFLSPTVATLLFPDLLQRFIPIKVFDDRAITLERSWERAWKEATGKDDFTAPFYDLWRSTDGQAQVKPPLLLLNSTVVETGQRLIMTPVALKTKGLEFDKVFRDAIDGGTLLGKDIPLSTAVHLSARFTYVSPAGKVFNSGDTARDSNWFRLVDGGYFENSGAVTATELLDAVIKRNKRHREEVQLMPFIIHISNEPIIPDKERRRNKVSYSPIMGEVLSPLRALLHVRPARGFQAREYLQRRLDEDKPSIVRHVHFRTCKGELDLPLGWMLSDVVQKNLISQFSKIGEVESPRGKYEAAANGYNLANMELVRQHLTNGQAIGKASADREDELISSCQ